MSACQKFQKIIYLTLLISIFLALLSSELKALASLNNECKPTQEALLVQTLTKYPLFDTPYKLAANYSPVLLLRALAHSNIYRKKGKAHVKREFYIKDLKGKFAEAFETLELDISVEATGLLGRKILASGKINNLNLNYENLIEVKLNNTASMKIKAFLEACEFLDLKVESKKSENSNTVLGSFFGKKVEYKTTWRDTEGILADKKYKIYVEGSTEGAFTLSSKGTIDVYQISGTGKQISENKYLMEEYYGPLYIKTELFVELAR